MPKRKKKKTSQDLDWMNLPLEIWTMIFAYLPPWFRPLIGTTCQVWYTVLSSMPSRKMTCVDAISKGWLDIVQWGLLHGFHLNEHICAAAAFEGHFEILKWLRSQTPPCPWNEDTCAWASSGGHLEMLKWAKSQTPPCPWDMRVFSHAAAGGHLEVLEWARTQRPSPWGFWESDVFNAAAGRGNLEILKWTIAARGSSRGDEVCIRAAAGGHLEVLKWARKYWNVRNEKVFVAATERGHLEVMKWLWRQGCHWNEDACICAAAKGYLEVLKWLRTKIFPPRWNIVSIREAATQGGHKDILEWLDA